LTRAWLVEKKGELHESFSKFKRRGTKELKGGGGGNRQQDNQRGRGKCPLWKPLGRRWKERWKKGKDLNGLEGENKRSEGKTRGREGQAGDDADSSLFNSINCGVIRVGHRIGPRSGHTTGTRVKKGHTFPGLYSYYMQLGEGVALKSSKKGKEKKTSTGRESGKESQPLFLLADRLSSGGRSSYYSAKGRKKKGRTKVGDLKRE